MLIREIVYTDIIDACICCPDCSSDYDSVEETCGYFCTADRNKPLDWETIDTEIPSWCPFAVDAKQES